MTFMTKDRDSTEMSWSRASGVWNDILPSQRQFSGVSTGCIEQGITQPQAQRLGLWGGEMLI